MNNTIYQLTGPRKFKRKVSTLREPSKDEVLIQFCFCGVCGSDLSTYHGFRNIDYPKSLGHEFVAKVISIGSSVTKFKVGDTVISDLNYRCGTCRYCKQEKSHLCESGQRGSFTNRGFANYSLIESSYLYKLQSEPNMLHCLIEPLSCVLHAYKQAEISKYDSVLMIGGGSLGLCGSMIVNNYGTKVTIDEAIPQRSKNLVDFFSLVSASENDKTFDVVLDFSGQYSGLIKAVHKCKKGGRIVSMSHLDGQDRTFDLLTELTRNDKRFLVSYLNGHTDNLYTAIKIVESFINNKTINNKIVNLHDITNINTVFSSRAGSPYNKDIIECSFT